MGSPVDSGSPALASPISLSDLVMIFKDRPRKVPHHLAAKVGKHLTRSPQRVAVEAGRTTADSGHNHYHGLCKPWLLPVRHL